MEAISKACAKGNPSGLFAVNGHSEDIETPSESNMERDIPASSNVIMMLSACLTVVQGDVYSWTCLGSLLLVGSGVFMSLSVR